MGVFYQYNYCTIPSQNKIKFCRYFKLRFTMAQEKKEKTHAAEPKHTAEKFEKNKKGVYGKR